MSTRKLLVDVHTHVYLPRYASFLRARAVAPKIFSRPVPGEPGAREDRLVILDNEPSGGRPIGPQYWDRPEKLAFMDKHGIDVSVVSSANPWLDFLSAPEANTLAKELNDDLEGFCSSSPELDSAPSGSGPSIKRLYGLGLLPLVPEASPSDVLKTITQISSLPHLKGVIMGTQGLGRGLDDEELEPVWGEIERNGLVVFLHPHYGVPSSMWGERDNGHVLPLALGFPFETTIAITRMILAGVLDKFPSLKIMLAHSGGALPALSSRLASCIDHDPVVASRLKHNARYYLGQLYFDAVAYGSEELGFGKLRALGSSRMLFGTDHPFFPPLKGTDKWRSVTENLAAINGVAGWGDKEREAVCGGNALRIFNLA
ncbi:amidohydrolase 2 [Thelephora ganbajun]|uniref:Amidohydrolase 2 n=1 Tax=Thelephora ganbajun TaxID=370292 RepID=A0ACB6ZCE2_THEGA|nr:amidohydrolase 2 [Thelephora ganbajun]